MCGIAGIVDFASRDGEAQAALVMRMRDALAHRGPDSWGVAELAGAVSRRHSAEGVLEASRPGSAAASVCLGHQRLAVIDLTEAGSQPMRSSDGHGWLAFNGELYNFRELQRDFNAAPGANSDAAVLLDILATHGTSALSRLRGMFAFAYWNEREEALYLVRDRFGIKPLYYARPTPSSILFASEPRALQAAGAGRERNATLDAVFLRRGHIPANLSYWRGLQVVPPGCLLRFDRHTAEVSRWYDLPAVLRSRPAEQPVSEAGAVLQAALDDSVRAHLVSDVPVGVFLSGGLDSAAIVAAAARAGARRLRTFTVVVPGSAIDESAPARAIASHYGTDHVEVPIPREELASWIEEALETMGEPTIDGLNTFLVSRAVARAGLKVVLSGLGGDEILGGYPSFRDVPLLWRATAPLRAGLPGRTLAGALARRMPVAAPGKLAEIAREPAGTVAGLWRQYRSLFERADIRALTGGEPPADDDGPHGEGMAPLDIVMLSEIEEYMSPQLLRDSDAFSMCDALELRVPFVDHILLQRVHEHGWWPRGGHRSRKAAIVAAMPDALPAGHLARRKTGFVIPTGDWIRAALAGDRALGGISGALSNPALQPYVDAFSRGRLDASRLWALVVRERFSRRAA